MVTMQLRSAPWGSVRLLLVLLPLLQFLGSHPSVGEAPPAIAGIVKHASYPNTAFGTYGGRVDFTNTAGVCRDHGGSLTADVTPSYNKAILDVMKDVATATDKEVYTYMGGDALYSVNREPDPKKKCQRGVEVASLNCIFRWNLGVYTGTKYGIDGVPFYKGTLYTLTGRGPMNNYPHFFNGNYPANGQTFLITWLKLTNEKTSTWYDGYGLGSGNKKLLVKSYVAACEVQKGFVINTTTKPPAEVEKSWVQQYWYVIMIATVVPVLALLFLPIICCCCVTYDESKFITPMVLREISGGPLYALERGNYGGYGGYWEDTVLPMQPVEEPQYTMGTNPAMDPPMPSPAWGQPPPPPQLGDTPAPKTFRRRNNRGRTSSNTFSTIDVPEGQEIAEGRDDTCLDSSTKRRSGRGSFSEITGGGL